MDERDTDGDLAAEPEAEAAPILAVPEVDPGLPLAPDVSYVVPPPIADAIDTEAEPASGAEAESDAVPPGPGASPPAGADLAPVLDAVAALGAAVAGRLDALQGRFDREVRAEANREKVVDRLHAELQEYKQGLLLGILRPVFVDLIQLHDDIGKMMAGADDAGGLAGVRQGIEDILYRQGVEPYTAEGDAFDPRRQRALSTVPNDDPALARTVAARVRVGFQAGDKVIRPEIVTVYAAPRRES